MHGRAMEASRGGGVRGPEAAEAAGSKSVTGWVRTPHATTCVSLRYLVLSYRLVGRVRRRHQAGSGDGSQGVAGGTIGIADLATGSR